MGSQGSPRLASVDVLRGTVMIVMALDHTRDFFANARFDPTDLTATTPAYFFTRLVTHFCAPVFVLLAGVGAALSASRGKPIRELSRFLVTRGLFLVLLELTVVRVAWFFDLHFRVFVGQVIWAIGWSMVALAGLVFLPRVVIASFGVAMIVFHNAFDAVRPDDLGRLGVLWKILHDPDPIRFGGCLFQPYYPLVPWIGVMAAGYALGPALLASRESRRKTLLCIGSGLVALFVALRATNLYGDPKAWSSQKDGLFTLMSLLNCAKYPPSLLFLAMTLGPTLIVLALLDGLALRPIAIYGRVPLFYYVIHLYLLHGVAFLLAYQRYGVSVFEITQANKPAGYGYPLPIVYAIWLGAVLLLYPACAWYAGLKARSRNPLLSYL